ncbi:metalloreductase transmembrane [Paramyrothecium foliicola]|nr:metalloreductase transmembrane [Paramyrothecium foliicola]
MDMGGMDGMDMGSSMFRTVNEQLSHIYWFIIAAVIACMLTSQILSYLESRWRLRQSNQQTTIHPSIPSNAFRQFVATSTAIFRELSHPRLWLFHNPSLTWLNPPPLGRVLVLIVYWSTIIALLVSNAIQKDAYFWERIGYRAAWVSVMQVPLLYLLSAKCSIIAILIGSSHERINWLHRWVARTLVVTAAIHGFHFYTEWVRADLVEIELEIMSKIVPYGFGAWAVLSWTLLVSLAPLRRLAYEVFVAQHIAAAAIFLWLLYVHVPKYARYYVWFAVAAWCFDLLGRLVLFIWVNWMPSMSAKSSAACCCKPKRLLLGHPTDVRVLSDEVTVVTIHNVRAKWRAGQHFYVWFPRLGLFETHPYTVMCASPCGCGLQLIIRKHTGFSRRLHEFGQKAQGDDMKTTAFIIGPYGSPAAWHTFETLVLISGSTGASYTLSILQDILKPDRITCTQKIHFLCMARRKNELEFYASQIRRLIKDSKKPGLQLQFTLALTSSCSKDVEAITTDLKTEPKSKVTKVTASEHDLEIQRAGCNCDGDGSSAEAGAGSDEVKMQYLNCRCDIKKFIQDPVESAMGETSVVVCGGGSLTCKVRNVVSWLSDERAVHKGSGLQGIHLHVEEYSL